MDYIIETRFDGPGFVPVPNAVAQMDELPADALGVLVYLASLPKGFAVRQMTVRNRFGFGKDKWQRIARDLAAVGALEVVKDRQPSGQMFTRYVVRWPQHGRAANRLEAEAEARQPEAEAPEPGFPAPGEPAPVNPPKNCGKPAKTGRKTRLPIQKEKRKTAREGARAASRRSPLGSGGGPRERMVDGRREILGPDGQWHRRPAEAAEAAQFDAWIASGAGGAHAEKARAS
jgi:hypothetical protein